MPYSHTAVSQAELDALATGAPMLSAANALFTRNVAVQWRSSGSWTTGTDDTDVNFPSARLHDGFLTTWSSPDSTQMGTSDEVSILCDLDDAAVSDVDFVMFKPLNFDDAAGTFNITVTADIDNNSDFSTAQTIATWTNVEANQRKFIDIDLTVGAAVNRRISGIRYFRLRIVTSDSTNGFSTTAMPRVAQLVLGRRRQLTHHSSIPFDEERYGALHTDFEADSRLLTRYITASGFRDFDLRLRPVASSAIGNDEVANIRALYVDALYGQRPVLYIEDPSVASPVPYWCMLVNPDLNMPLRGFTERQLRMELREQPPFRTTETY